LPLHLKNMWESSINVNVGISLLRPTLKPRKPLLRRQDSIPTVCTPTKFGQEHAFFDVTSDIVTK
jgi:hypothetical protein